MLFKNLSKIFKNNTGAPNKNHGPSSLKNDGTEPIEPVAGAPKPRRKKVGVTQTVEKKLLSSSKSSNADDSVQSFLRQNALFKDLDDDFINATAAIMQVRVFNDKDFVIRKGEVGRALFFVKRGTVEAISEDGETILNVMSEGSFFGEIGLLFAVPRTATCRCVGRCIVLVLTKEKFKKTMDASPVAANIISRIAEERFASYVKQANAGVNIDFGDEMALTITNDDLRNVPLFRNCHVGFLHMLALDLTPCYFKENQMIIKKGEISGEMYFVASGTAIIIDDESGEIYGTFKGGTFFGEVGLLFSIPRTADVRCISKSMTVFRLLKEDLDKVLLNFPEIDEEIKKEAKLRFKRYNTTNSGSNMPRTINRIFADVDIIRELLKSIPLFQESSIGFLDQLALCVKPRKFSANDIIFSKGDDATSLFFVVDGVCCVISEDGQKVYAELPRSSFFGEVALFYDIKRTASIRAKSDCYLLELPKVAFQVVQSSYPKFSKTMEDTAKEMYERVLAREAAIKLVTQKSQAEELTVEATIARLRKVPIFSTCDMNFLRSVATSTSIHVHERTDYIVRYGEKASSMFFIVEGQVQIVSDESDEIFDTIDEGDYFGEVGLLLGISRTASVRVSSDECSIIVLTLPALENVSRNHNDSYQSILLEAARRYKLVEQRKQRYGQGEEDTGTLSRCSSDGSIDSVFLSRSGSAFLEMDSTPSHASTLRPRLLSNLVKSQSFRRRPARILDLDSECFFNIFRQLGIREQLNMRLVCKKWYENLENEQFWTKFDFRQIFSGFNPAVLNNLFNIFGAVISELNFQNCFRMTDRQLLVIGKLCPIVEKLNISNCWNVTDTGIMYIARYLRSLTHLDVSYCMKITGSGFRKSKWTNLTNLNLSYLKRLRDNSLKELASGSPKLTYVSMRRCTAITDAGVWVLVRHCASVSSLDFTDMEAITEKSLRYFSHGLTNLRSLNLTFCTRITTLSDLISHASNLTLMNLSNCVNISDTALLQLLEKCQTLEYLGLRGTRISGACLVSLCEMISTLKYVNVSQCNKVTFNTVQALSETYPSLTIDGSKRSATKQK